MKKQLLLLSFIVLFVGTVNRSHAQTSYTSGHFDVSGQSRVNYLVGPATLTDTLNLQLDVLDLTTLTGNAAFLSADILNSSNTVLQSWSPSSTSANYFTQFNINALAPGTYHINIKDSSSAILQSISFTK